MDGAVAEPGMGGAPPASGRDDRQGEAEKRAGDARARGGRGRESTMPVDGVLAEAEQPRAAAKLTLARRQP